MVVIIAFLITTVALGGVVRGFGFTGGVGFTTPVVSFEILQYLLQYFESIPIILQYFYILQYFLQ